VSGHLRFRLCLDTYRGPFSNFDDPDEESRKLYVLFWKKKLENNHDIDFSDKLVDEVAKSTSRFSFAYLKEAL
jgi:transitional endoplasmic reticulum ATPase